MVIAATGARSLPSSAPRGLAAIALCVLSLASPVSAQAPAPTFQETLDVDLVNVDVIAVDADGNLVTDLERDDFQVTDDGRKMRVGYFAKIGTLASAATASTAAAAGSAGAPAAGSPESARGPRHLIVFVDLDSGVQAMRDRRLDEVSAYLAENARGLSTMVVTYGRRGLQIQRPFSSVPAEWSAALAAAKEMPSRGVQRRADQQRMVDSIKEIQQRADLGTGEALQRAREQLSQVIASARHASEATRTEAMATLRALQTLISVLSTVPGPKSLLYVGDGVPVRPGEDIFDLLAEVFEGDRRFDEEGGPADTPANPGSAPLPPDPSGAPPGAGLAVLEPGFEPMMESTATLRNEASQFDLTPELRALTATANSHRVTIFGLSSDRAGSVRSADSNPGGRVAPAATLAYDVTRSQLRLESLDRMAGDTGGLSLGADAPAGAFLDRVLADAGNRYSLAYVSPHGGDGRYHDIKVKVARKGLDLRYREGYIDRPRQVRIGDLVAGALLLGSGDNPLGLELAVASQRPGEDDQVVLTLALRIPIDQLHLTPAGARHESKLEIYILTRDAAGTLAPMRTVAYTVAIPTERMAEAKGKLYGATLPLVLSRGRQSIAVGIVESAVQRTSVASTELVVGAMPSAPGS